MQAVLDAVIGWLQSMHPTLRILVAGLGIALETSVLVGLVVPGDTILLVAGLGTRSIWDWAALVVAAVLGALAGESAGFAIGRHYGPRIRTSWLGRRLGERNLARADAYVARRGGVAIFISRFLPVLHSLVPLTVGISAMPYRKFLAWTLPASLIWSVAYVTVASAAAATYSELSRNLHWAGYLFIAGIVLGGVLLVVARKLIGRSQMRYIDVDAIVGDAATALLHDGGEPDPHVTTAADRDTTKPGSEATRRSDP